MHQAQACAYFNQVNLLKEANSFHISNTLLGDCVLLWLRNLLLKERFYLLLVHCYHTFLYVHFITS